VIDVARSERPSLLAVDSIQTLRDPDSSGLPGGPAQVRACTDALVGVAKAEGITVIMTGHVTKEGDLAGPRTLEHAVDVVLGFEGDPRSGLRTLVGGKNRFGRDGELAWFEMREGGLSEVDPGIALSSGGGEPGSATALPVAGRRALAVEVQALAVGTDGPARRQVTGLDLRRFSLIAAVLDQVAQVKTRHSDLYGAAAGGLRLDDPGADLAIAAAVASAVTGRAPPPGSAFVGEVGLTGAVRAVSGMGSRLGAAAALGLKTVYAPSTEPSRATSGVAIVGAATIFEALAWARGGSVGHTSRALVGTGGKGPTAGN
jgi:DNA repair protein RadA/Sms